MRIDRVRLAEPLELGQRVRAFELETHASGGDRRPLASGTTLGARRNLTFAPCEAEAVRGIVSSARAAPALSAVALTASSSRRRTPGVELHVAPGASAP